MASMVVGLVWLIHLHQQVTGGYLEQSRETQWIFNDEPNISLKVFKRKHKDVTQIITMYFYLY